MIGTALRSPLGLTRHEWSYNRQTPSLSDLESFSRATQVPLWLLIAMASDTADLENGTAEALKEASNALGLLGMACLRAASGSRPAILEAMLRNQPRQKKGGAP